MFDSETRRKVDAVRSDGKFAATFHYSLAFSLHESSTGGRDNRWLGLLVGTAGLLTSVWQSPLRTILAPVLLILLCDAQHRLLLHVGDRSWASESADCLDLPEVEKHGALDFASRKTHPKTTTTVRTLKWQRKITVLLKSKQRPLILTLRFWELSSRRQKVYISLQGGRLSGKARKDYDQM